MVRNIYAGMVTSKGQVTVPKPIRERLGLKQGDRIEFVAESGRTLVRRARKSANPFAKYAGTLGTFRGGSAKRLLVDFIVGAHALIRADRLLTLDASRYAKDFPELKHITCG